MTFLFILGGFALVLAVIGAIMFVRQRRARDYADHLDSRDTPGRGPTDAQAAAGLGHHSRGTGAGMGSGF